MAGVCQADLSLLPSLVEILPGVDPTSIQRWLQLTFTDGSRILDVKSDLFNEVVLLIREQVDGGVSAEEIGSGLARARNAEHLIYDLAPTPHLARLHEASEFRRRTQHFSEEVQGPPCAKCTSTDTTFRFQQTRSADEPVSSNYRCNSCGARWG